MATNTAVASVVVVVVDAVTLVVITVTAVVVIVVMNVVRDGSADRSGWLGKGDHRRQRG